ncbi:transcriptional regulator of middle promoters [Shigella phage ESh32]|nr:transcriptional regulator of middle promoters [Shigella phage ESh32]
MSKVTYIIKASNDVLNEKTAAILITIAKKDFITAAEVREVHPYLGNAVVNSNIGVLIKKGLVEKSGDGLIITGEAQDIISNAATLYAQENAPELLKKRATRKAREITSDMEEDKDLMLKLLDENGFVLKKVETYRSNYLAILEKRTHGIRNFEINNNGNMRIFGYKMMEHHIQKFTDIGMSCKIAKNGNVYLDIKRSAENIEAVITVASEL